MFYKSVASDVLKNPELNGGSTIAVVEAKTTLARASEVTLTVETLWVRIKSKSELSPREALQNICYVSIF